VNPATKSQRALALLGPYDHYKVVDAKTIQIVLKSPYTPLLDGLAQINTAIASPQALQKYDLTQYQYHQVGTGPFIMVDYVPGDHFTVRRNPNYTWGPKFYLPTVPQSVDEIDFKFFADPATRAAALESGAANIIGELSPTDAILFTGNSQLRLYPQAIPGESLQFLFNTTFAPTDKVDFRRTLLTATNRTGLVDSLFQQFSPTAYGPLSANMPFFEPKVNSLYPFDATAAQVDFRKLGYGIDSTSNMLTLGGNRLHLIMVVPAWGFAPEVAALLQRQWHDQGIELEIKEVPNLAGLDDIVKSGKYNLIAYEDFGLDPDLLSTIFRSDGLNNWSHYANADMDNWLITGRQASDTATRQNMYTAVEVNAMDQALTLPIRDYVNLNGASAAINGLAFDAYGWYPLLPNLTINQAIQPTPKP
jgi:peptide/nickel transport system substrate-binding protein